MVVPDGGPVHDRHHGEDGHMTTLISFTPPTGDLFAAVQVEASHDGRGWRIVGASPAFRLESRPTGRTIEVDGEQVEEIERVMVQASSVAVDCKLQPADQLIRCAWVHEDSSRGLEWVGPMAPHERAAGRGTSTYGGR